MNGVKGQGIKNVVKVMRRSILFIQILHRLHMT